MIKRLKSFLKANQGEGLVNFLIVMGIIVGIVAFALPLVNGYIDDLKAVEDGTKTIPGA